MDVRKALQNDWQHTWYCLKIDIRHFFDNIDREILFNMLKKKLKDRDVLDMLHTIIFNVPGSKGLPIGLYSSQILSVFYLNGFDHYCKEKLAVKHYYRFMDDIVILASNKVLLHNYLRLMNRYLSILKLTIKRNRAIFPIEKRRLDFVGFVFNHKDVAIRRSTVLSYKRACNFIIYLLRRHLPVSAHLVMSKISYEGIIRWGSSDRLINICNNKVDIILIGADSSWNTGTTSHLGSDSRRSSTTAHMSMCAGTS